MLLEKLVKKASKGNERAFQELINAEKDKLYRIAYLYTKNERDAMEIVHDTVYKAYISIPKLKNAEYFSTWLTRILINSALDMIKKKARVVPLNQEAIERLTTPHQSNLEDRLDLVKAIEELEEKYKTVIILRYYKDYSVKQIAELIDSPEGTVKVNIHRALQKLKLEMKGDCINE